MTSDEAQANVYEPCYITIDVPFRSCPLQAYDMGYLWITGGEYGFWICRYDGVIVLTLADRVTPILPFLCAGNPPSEYWIDKSRKTNKQLRLEVNTPQAPRQLALFDLETA